MICALGFFWFTLAVKFLPIFEEEHHAAHVEPALQLGDVREPSLVN
jgi:hypothetical protein